MQPRAVVHGLAIAPPPVAVPPFALGVDERNPHLYAPGPQPAPFGRFRDALVALHPTYIRVQVNWSVLQPRADAPPDWTIHNGGCARDVPPCAPFAGILEALAGVRELGARPVLLIYGTPAWAAQPATGCEEPGTTPFARMPRLAAYRAFARSLHGLIVKSRLAAVTTWSAWNEPNLPVFLNPQRTVCDPSAPTAAAGNYARLVRALAAEVGLRRVLVGEASQVGTHTHSTGAAELAAALPDHLVCGAAAWSQHAYVTVPLDRGASAKAVDLAQNADTLRSVEIQLAGHRCAHRVPIWITETGAGSRPGACAAMAAQLRAWRTDPQVAAAFQYSFRDDPVFPVGLADAKLTRTYPSYKAWRGEACRG